MLVEGLTLDDVLLLYEPALLARAAMIDALCDGLSAVHSEGLLHRDIKPQNIMVATPDLDDPVLVDFGCVKLEDAAPITLTAAGLGTLGYMAPEVRESQKHASRLSDQWSLARTALEAFAVSRLLSYDEAKSMTAPDLFAHLSDLGLPTIATSLAQALEIDPEKRYPSVGEFKEAFEHAVEEDLQSELVLLVNSEGLSRLPGETLLEYCSRFDLPVIDKRSSGGNFWVLADHEQFVPYRDALRAQSVYFTFAASGGRASRHRFAWFSSSSA